MEPQIIEQPKVKWSTTSESLMFRREFLNQPGKGSAACIIAKVTKIKEFKNEVLTEDFVESELSISDCNNKINLSIGVSKDNIENSIYKLNKLIDVLTELKGVIEEEKSRRDRDSIEENKNSIGNEDIL
jgi:hypothetical protein